MPAGMVDGGSLKLTPVPYCTRSRPPSGSVISAQRINPSSPHVAFVTPYGVVIDVIVSFTPYAKDEVSPNRSVIDCSRPFESYANVPLRPNGSVILVTLSGSVCSYASVVVWPTASVTAVNRSELS